MTDTAAVVLRGAADIDRAVVRRVAAGTPVRLDPALLDRVDHARRAGLAALHAGARVYGVTTSTGVRSDVDLDPEQQRHHQADLLRGRAVGGPPYLDTEEARAIVVARLTDLLSGHAAVSSDLCLALVDLLNDGYAPAVPAAGVGTAGEIQPLAHAFLPLLGIGPVHAPDGRLVDAAQALTDRGAAPLTLGPKEGIALLAGAPAAPAILTIALARVERIATSVEVVVAATLDAADAPGDAHGTTAARLAGDPLYAEVLTALRSWRGHGPDVAGTGAQAPVSFRVAPVVQTHLRRTLHRAGEDADRALAAVTDSPAFVDGRFLSTAGFHAVEVAAASDTLRAALVRVGELSCQRIHRLLDTRVTGLPPLLAASAGSAGMVVVHKRAVAAAAELRRLAPPVSVGLADTALGQEDAQTFTFAAAAELRRAELLVAEVVACELACVLQAWWLRGGDPPARLAAVLGPAREILPPVVTDRPLGDELDRLAGLVATGLVTA